MTDDDTEGYAMARDRTHRIWLALAWTAAVSATVLNGFVVGYGAVTLQFFGESADAEDYWFSQGGYAAAAFVLASAVPAILAYRGPRWLTIPAVGFAILYTALAKEAGLLAEAAARRAVQYGDSPPGNAVWEGICGVMWAPWTWGLVMLGLWATVRLIRHGVRAGVQPAQHRS